MLESQGDTPRNEEGRLQHRVRKKYPRDDKVDQAGTAKINYATSILKSYRATDRYVKLEIDLMGAQDSDLMGAPAGIIRESMETHTVQIYALEDKDNSSSVMNHSGNTSHVSYLQVLLVEFLSLKQKHLNHWNIGERKLTSCTGRGDYGRG